MADFTSSGWSVYIMVITAAGLVACFWLTFALSKKRTGGGEVGTTGHKWDETLEEYNHPLPRWWIWLFYLTIVFAVVYLVLYPGFGASKGTFGWSSTGQYEQEVAKAKAVYEPLFAKYLQQEVPQVAADPEARAMGERLYLTYCVQCHGSDARGSKGFPNLADSDWIWGGDPASIEKTLHEGRNGMMPPMGAAVGTAADVEDVANYVLSLSGSGHDALKAARGQTKFAACAACHGADGKGNPALGAPNLTDKTWLYGGSLASIVETINNGRSNQMPAFGQLLGDGKIRVLAAYVWGLSNAPQKTASSQ
ncbi:MAG TPA: cytochrome-c oxidase, cbb3-type subunit III [Quisquiliibacterium sp.]|nr:cytochrome-c oxidase, cbb3-type subunit III [Quisquiliibacterium sp.]